MPLRETPDDTPEPRYALTRSNDLVEIGDAVTEDACEVRYPGSDAPNPRPPIATTSTLYFLPEGTSYREAVRMKLARAGMPIPSSS